jgi:hypothetical protein
MRALPIAQVSRGAGGGERDDVTERWVCGPARVWINDETNETGDIS